MARPRTPIGTYGDVRIDQLPTGVWRARARLRDFDGRVRRVEGRGTSKLTAEHNLKQKINVVLARAAGSEGLCADSPFEVLVDVWLADLDMESRVNVTTRDLYERNMRQLVLPEFKYLTLREIGVAKVDRFLKRLNNEESYSYAKQAKTVWSLAFGVAVRYEAISRNPVREVARLPRSRR